MAKDKLETETDVAQQTIGGLAKKKGKQEQFILGAFVWMQLAAMWLGQPHGRLTYNALNICCDCCCVCSECAVRARTAQSAHATRAHMHTRTCVSARTHKDAHKHTKHTHAYARACVRAHARRQVQLYIHAQYFCARTHVRIA